MTDVAHFIREWFQVVAALSALIVSATKAWPVIYKTWVKFKYFMLFDIYHRLNRIDKIVGIDELEEEEVAK